MKYLVRSKFGGTVLVLLGFGGWYGAFLVMPESSDWFSVVTYLVSAFSFFLVGCFLPEYREKHRILSRRSALLLMAFFLWMSLSATARLEIVKEARESFDWITSVLISTAIPGGFGSYYLATFLIRGFRAPPEYETLAGTVQPEPADESSQLKPAPHF